MPQRWQIIAILILFLITVGVYLDRPPILTHLTSANVDIVLSSTGCSTEHFVLSAQRAPHISLVNQADQAMVFTLPKMIIARTIAPGQRITLDLPPYIMGEFDFFCLTDTAHTSIGGMSGDDGFVCGLESTAIRPYALTSGTFEIEPHDRLKHLLESRSSAREQVHTAITVHTSHIAPALYWSEMGYHRQDAGATVVRSPTCEQGRTGI